MFRADLTNRSYAFLSSWIGNDIKRFCCCITKPAAKTVAPRSVDGSVPAADLGETFEKRDPQPIAGIVQEAHEISQKATDGLLKELQSSDEQSFFGPPRLQGYGGSVNRKRRTTVKTMTEVTTEEY